jgi:hypothetical protein
MNPKAHYNAHNRPSPVPSWATSIQTIPPILSKIRFNIIQPPTSLSLQKQVQKYLNKKFCKELITYSPLVLYGPHRKRRAQQFLYCCVVYQLLSPSNHGGYTWWHTCRWEGFMDRLRCHGIHTEFHKTWLKDSKVDKGRQKKTMILIS